MRDLLIVFCENFGSNLYEKIMSEQDYDKLFIALTPYAVCSLNQMGIDFKVADQYTVPMDLEFQNVLNDFKNERTKVFAQYAFERQRAFDYYFDLIRKIMKIEKANERGIRLAYLGNNLLEIKNVLDYIDEINCKMDVRTKDSNKE